MARLPMQERPNSLGLGALRTLGDVELHPLVLVQAAVTAGLNRGEVNEHVRAVVVVADETEALVGVEPLHSSLCHDISP